jgi:drug/metabolite transporter (DMT)-like permease
MNLKAVLIALLAFAIYSSHDVVVKYLGALYSPFQIIFFTSLLSFPLVTLMLVRDPTAGNLRPVHPWWLALRSLAMATGATSAFYAFSVLPLAQTYAILFASPLLITLLSIPVLGEKVGLHRALAVLVGLAGVLVVLRPGATDLTLGHLAALVAALANATQSVIVRKIGREERRVVMMLYPLAATFLVMGVALPFVYVPMPVFDLGAMAIVAVFGFIAALCLVLAYTMGEAAVVAPMQYSQIVWAALYGFFLFGESIDRATWIGAGIVIASGLYIVLREALGGRSENTPVLHTRSRSYAPGSFRISQTLRRKR